MTLQGGVMGEAVTQCSSCLRKRSRTRSTAAVMAANHWGDSAGGKGDSGSPSCPTPKVLLAQEGGMGFSVTQLWPREVCNGDRGAASSDNHGSCFRASCTRLVPPGWDPPWGESQLPRDASKPLTIFLGDGESPHSVLSLACSLSPGFSLRLY